MDFGPFLIRPDQSATLLFLFTRSSALGKDKHGFGDVHQRVYKLGQICC